MKESQVTLLLLVDLCEAVMSHYSFIQSASSECICGDKVQHVFISQLAYSSLGVAKDVYRPGLVEEELLHAKNCSLMVNDITLDSLLAETYEVASGHK